LSLISPYSRLELSMLQAFTLHIEIVFVRGPQRDASAWRALVRILGILQEQRSHHAEESNASKQQGLQRAKLGVVQSIPPEGSSVLRVATCNHTLRSFNRTTRITSTPACSECISCLGSIFCADTASGDLQPTGACAAALQSSEQV
jgi:hypothetical protein